MINHSLRLSWNLREAFMRGRGEFQTLISNSLILMVFSSNHKHSRELGAQCVLLEFHLITKLPWRAHIRSSVLLETRRLHNETQYSESRNLEDTKKRLSAREWRGDFFTKLWLIDESTTRFHCKAKYGFAMVNEWYYLLLTCFQIPNLTHWLIFEAYANLPLFTHHENSISSLSESFSYKSVSIFSRFDVMINFIGYSATFLYLLEG